MGCPSGMVWFARRVLGGERSRWRVGTRMAGKIGKEDERRSRAICAANVMWQTGCLTFRLILLTGIGAELGGGNCGGRMLTGIAERVLGECERWGLVVEEGLVGGEE